MVAAKTANKIVAVPLMGFGIGMMFFPIQLMSAYGPDAFPKGSTAEIMAMFALGVVGLQFMQAGIYNVGFSRKGASEEGSGLLCLFAALLHVVMGLCDTKYLLTRKHADIMPASALYPNYVLEAVFVGVTLSGWRAAGSPMPRIGLPTGILSAPITATGVNLGFFAAGLTLATSSFGEMYFPGLQAKIPAGQLELINYMLFAGGALMFTNIASLFGTTGVDADTNYRLLRASVYAMMIYLGQFAREGNIYRVAGWDVPLYGITFIQCFAVTFFCTSKLGEHPVKVSKSE